MTMRRSRSDILSDRLKMTLAISEANAEHHRAQAMAHGAEIGLMKTEEAGGNAADADAASAAQADNDAAQSRLAAAEAKVEALTAQLAELDLELMSADDGKDTR